MFVTFIAQIHYTIEQLPLLDAERLQDERECQRAFLVLSLISHAYVWGAKGEPVLDVCYMKILSLHMIIDFTKAIIHSLVGHQQAIGFTAHLLSCCPGLLQLAAVKQVRAHRFDVGHLNPFDLIMLLLLIGTWRPFTRFPEALMNPGFT